MCLIKELCQGGDSLRGEGAERGHAVAGQGGLAEGSATHDEAGLSPRDQIVGDRVASASHSGGDGIHAV